MFAYLVGTTHTHTNTKYTKSPEYISEAQLLPLIPCINTRSPVAPLLLLLFPIIIDIKTRHRMLCLYLSPRKTSRDEKKEKKNKSNVLATWRISIGIEVQCDRIQLFLCTQFLMCLHSLFAFCAHTHCKDSFSLSHCLISYVYAFFYLLVSFHFRYVC